MTETLTQNNEKEKNALIIKLLNEGVYKTKNRQLYQLSFNELKTLYKKILQP
ncbi:Fur-regulated basic protein FbpA [Sporolactobacillus terrae]|uniref:Fur-regulated basic protein FbpA n=1 Tax=Sporolactobacillus terrae TaxID=269673 RepID=A0A410D7W4_9BACL|nr:Fur-regulated basic protein FbpA [Sporolactobacillus terrae]QAA22186.1 Fur-regulated basic protein FbpA [Sporolactobacillus terrae]QAA25159.1 Fur-regulated basic protein FbpA [Sporolactobacillus terrae]UAK16980.1 Fur-regulated basic protein FbpA [Sporolactobacillus terrae]BBN98493.1 hypothetical protein St703_11980 [Sporolactobacillus terrae]